MPWAATAFPPIRPLPGRRTGARTLYHLRPPPSPDPVCHDAQPFAQPRFRSRTPHRTDRLAPTSPYLRSSHGKQNDGHVVRILSTETPNIRLDCIMRLTVPLVSKRLSPTPLAWGRRLGTSAHTRDRPHLGISPRDRGLHEHLDTAPRCRQAAWVPTMSDTLSGSLPSRAENQPRDHLVGLHPEQQVPRAPRAAALGALLRVLVLVAPIPAASASLQSAEFPPCVGHANTWEIRQELIRKSWCFAGGAFSIVGARLRLARRRVAFGNLPRKGVMVKNPSSAGCRRPETVCNKGRGKKKNCPSVSMSGDGLWVDLASVHPNVTCWDALPFQLAFPARPGRFA